MTASEPSFRGIGLSFIGDTDELKLTNDCGGSDYAFFMMVTPG